MDMKKVIEDLLDGFEEVSVFKLGNTVTDVIAKLVELGNEGKKVMVEVNGRVLLSNMTEESMYLKMLGKSKKEHQEYEERRDREYEEEKKQNEEECKKALESELPEYEKLLQEAYPHNQELVKTKIKNTTSGLESSRKYSLDSMRKWIAFFNTAKTLSSEEIIKKYKGSNSDPYERIRFSGFELSSWIGCDRELVDAIKADINEALSYDNEREDRDKNLNIVEENFKKVQAYKKSLQGSGSNQEAGGLEME